MDIICVIILFIIIGSFAFDHYGDSQTTRLFVLLLIATTWALFLDFLNWAFDGSLVMGGWTYWFTVGSLCMGSILACLFSLYLYCYMNETHNLSKMKVSARVCAIANLVSFCITLVLALTKTAFDFVDGHYTTGVLYDVVTVIPVLTLLYLTGYFFRYVKFIGMHDMIAVAGYILFMVAGALIEAGYSIGTTYVSVAIADVFIFVMLQSEIIAREKRNVELWIQRSKTDELTGLFNRHAYEEEIALLEKRPLENDFVYVSIDVNALKVVNDSLGHYAGDEMIIGAAECLKKCFGALGKLYRVGGDEFVALIFADESHMKVLKKNIVDITKAWHGNMADTLSVSCGFVSQKEEKGSIRQMAILADKRMYEEKEEYYRLKGVTQRK